MQSGTFAATSNARGYSGAVFAGIDIDEIQARPARGLFIHEDFLNFPNRAGASSDVTGYWGSHQYLSEAGSSAGAAVAQSTTEPGGVITVTASDTADDAWAIQRAGAGVLIAASSIKRVAFECRMKVSTITDSLHTFFAGLLEVNAIAAGVPLPDDGSSTEFSDNNLIGFTRQEGTGKGALVRFGYKADGQTIQSPVTSLATLVADTYVKLGFNIDFSRRETTTGRLFVNGAEYTTTYLTLANLTAATFPSDVTLHPTLAAKCVTATTPGTITWDSYTLAVEYK